MRLHEGKVMYSASAGFEVVLGEPRWLEDELYFPVVYDDLSSEIVSETRIRSRFYETLEERDAS